MDTAPDDKEALQWYRRAATLGDANGMNWAAAAPASARVDLLKAPRDRLKRCV